MRAKKRPSDNRGPEPIGEVLSRLFTSRGWGRRQDRLQLEQAWNEVAGEDFAPHTELGSFRRGVLEITVGNAVLLQELSSFHKRRLLEAMRGQLPSLSIHDLRFRAGVIKNGNDNRNP